MLFYLEKLTYFDIFVTYFATFPRHKKDIFWFKKWHKISRSAYQTSRKTKLNAVLDRDNRGTGKKVPWHVRAPIDSVDDHAGVRCKLGGKRRNVSAKFDQENMIKMCLTEFNLTWDIPLRMLLKLLRVKSTASQVLKLVMPPNLVRKEGEKVKFYSFLNAYSWFLPRRSRFFAFLQFEPRWQACSGWRTREATPEKANSTWN